MRSPHRYVDTLRLKDGDRRRKVPGIGYSNSQFSVLNSLNDLQQLEIGQRQNGERWHALAFPERNWSDVSMCGDEQSDDRAMRDDRDGLLGVAAEHALHGIAEPRAGLVGGLLAQHQFIRQFEQRGDALLECLGREPADALARMLVQPGGELMCYAQAHCDERASLSRLPLGTRDDQIGGEAG